MKKLKFLPLLLTLCLLVTVLIPCASADVLDYTTKPQSSSPHVILADVDNNKILYSVGADSKAYPASTTKIMTVLLAVEAIERGDVKPEDMVTAKSGFLYGISTDASNAGIVEGETMSLIDLLYCAMLPSANEACNIIAMHVAGSIADFVDRMNTRAQELGCTGTHFVNTNGMPDENHYTTARDLYLISSEAVKHEKFAEICDSASYITAATNMNGERELHNSNALIYSGSVYGDSYVYEGAYGVKTGHTDAAGHCLVAAVKRGDLNLMCVVMGAQGNYEDKNFDSFNDAVSLFDWAFGNFSRHSLLDAGTVVGEMPVNLGDGVDKVAVVAASDVMAMAPMGLGSEHIVTKLTLNSDSVDAPVLERDVLGKVEVYDDSGEYYGETEVVAKDTVQMAVGEYLTDYTKSFFARYWMLIAGIVAGVIILVFAVVLLKHKAKKKKARYAPPAHAAKGKGGKKVKR